MATGIFTLRQVNQAISQGAWSGYIAPKWVEYLVVAGGGGGNYTGGGGAGGVLTGIVTVAAGASYTVTIGTGGAGNTAAAYNAVEGIASVFGSISATGGGAGIGNYLAPATKNNGGSGGGGAISAIPSGQGTSGQGNAGGLGSATNAGGGGGAGTVGVNATTYSGNGGAGIASAITGSVVTYGGGGGGGCANSINTNFGLGGVGGGGNATTTTGVNGGGNTGGGGGGGSYVGPTFYAGGNGGSGIVVVRYPGTVQFFTGGTLSYANGYIIHTFYASGTLAPTTPTPYVTDYQISRSLRFNSADSTYLNRTPASASNQKTWTWSGWVKRSALGTNQTFFNAGGNGFIARFNSSTDYLEVYNYSGAYQLQVLTAQVFRDVSAWYHLVISIDTTQATDTNRFKLYVNGSQVTSFYGAPTYPSQNTDLFVNGTNVHALGVLNGIGQYFDGYMTEVNFIDGQALTPSSFGYTNPATGVWSPLAFVGTYGTNGFELTFADNSNTTAATLGKDYSGNGNNWTPNNFSVTAGAGNDSLVDSPTSYGTDTGVGGSVRGNYCTLNPLDKSTTGGAAKNGNLDYAATQASWDMIRSTFGMSSGKWYWEVSVNSSSFGITGIAQASVVLQNNYFNSGFCSGYNSANGNKYDGNAGSTTYGASWNASNDICGVAFDADAGTLTFYKNGTSQGVAYTGLSGTYFPAHTLYDTSTATLNFGQRPFAYTAPSGFKALCTQNLPTPTIGAATATLAGKFFNPVLYTGTGATRSVTGVGFQPDWVWIKSRSTAGYSHRLVDAVRGVTKEIYSNLTNAEGTDSNGLTAFGSDGFTLGSSNEYNASGSTFVAWNWKANGSGSTNTAGSITSTVSANTTSGFSVVTYTGTGSAGATVGHGLGTVPSMIIFKRRNATSDWQVYHTSLGNAASVYLNLTNSSASSPGMLNSTTPTSTLITLGTSTDTNPSTGTMVAYCFAPIAGYSAFGQYTGNGSADGPFVYCGFRPKYFLWKPSSAVGSWGIYDSARNTYNVEKDGLLANTSGAEADFGSQYYLDFLSNGFKIKGNGSGFNGSGETIIFMAFAENPFKYSLAR
jgi:hypothetical protein